MNAKEVARAAIVLVNWRGARDTIECLESLLRLNRTDFIVIVCDNASDDGSLNLISEWADGRVLADLSGAPWALMPRSRQPKEIDLWRVNAQDLLQGAKPSELHFLTLIEAGANLGFAGANNLACRFALSIPSISYVWFLNTDTVVDPFAYEELFKRCELDPTIGQCGATLLFYDQPFLVQALGGSLYNPITGRAKHFAFGVPRSKLPDKSQVEPYLAYVAGASLFSTRKFLEATGPMREDYFLYFEELDWAMRRPKHLRMAWEPAALVYHKEGASIGSASTGRGSDMSLYYLTRNALLFTARYRRVYLPTVIARVVVEMWRYHRKGDPRAVRTLIASVRDFIMRRYGQAALSQEMSTNHTLREL